MTTPVPDLDPEMASLLLMGESARARSDLDLARRCYRTALELHPGHHGALLNLGVTLVELWQFRAALDVLGHLEVALDAEADDGELVEVRLSGRYNAAIAHWYLACGGSGARHDTHLVNALITARELALAVPVGLARRDLPPNRTSVVHALEGATLALLQGIMIDALAAGVRPDREAARAIELEPGEMQRRWLRRTPVDAPAWRSGLATERWYRWQTEQLLFEALTKRHKRDPRTRYNLAVARARLLPLSPDNPPPVFVDRALADLDYAIQHDPTHVQWARRDRLIQPLRELDQRRFDKILERAPR